MGECRLLSGRSGVVGLTEERRAWGSCLACPRVVCLILLVRCLVRIVVLGVLRMLRMLRLLSCACCRCWLCGACCREACIASDPVAEAIVLESLCILPNSLPAWILDRYALPRDPMTIKSPAAIAVTRLMDRRCLRVQASSCDCWALSEARWRVIQFCLIRLSSGTILGTSLLPASPALFAPFRTDDTLESPPLTLRSASANADDEPLALRPSMLVLRVFSIVLVYFRWVPDAHCWRVLPSYDADWLRR